MNGFKSFASPVKLEFSPGISAIVGPNGSGKSNITDAIRYVIGEQSTRAMRSQKLEDVIFSGTGKVKKKDTCEVLLTLTDDEETLHISRKFFRTGESRFKVNGKAARLRDIQEIFTDTGLGKNGYSMVSQGGIEDIVNATPQRLRSLVAEAAGIAGFQAKKEETQKKLDQMQENIERVRDILLEVEKRLKPLEKQSEKARQYKTLFQSLRAVELLLYLLEKEEKDQSLRVLEEERKQARFELLDAKRSADSQDKVYLKIRDERTKEKEALDALSEWIRTAREQIFDGEKEEAGLEAEGKNLDRELDRLKMDMMKVSKETSEYRKTLLSEWKKKEAGEKTTERLEQTLEDLQKSREEEQNRLHRLLDHKKREDLAFEEARKNRQNLEREVFEVRSGIERARENAARLEEERESLQLALSRFFQEEKETREKQELEEKHLSSILEREEKLCEKTEQLDKAIRKAYENYQKIDSDIKYINNRIEYENRLYENFSPYSQAVKFVMKNADDHVLGPFAHLIEIPEEYETAVSTALGSKAQNLVVLDEKTAGRQIDLLKRNRAGRAAFLPLDALRTKKVRPDELERIRRDSGIIGLASDLVVCEERVKPAAQSLLGNVLVVEKFKNAGQTRKRFPTFTIVTLEGEIFYPGGAIIGGSQGGKGKSVFFNKNKIDTLKKDLSEKKKQARQEARSHQESKTRVKQLEKEKGAVAAEIKISQQKVWQYRQKMNLLASQIEEAQKTERDQEHAAKTALSEAESQEDRLHALNKALEKPVAESTEKSDDSEERIRALILEKADEETKIRIRIAREEEKTASLDKSIGDLVESLCALDEESEALKRAIVRNRRTRNFCLEKILNMRENLLTLKTRYDESEKREREGMERIRRLEGKLEEAEDQLKIFNRITIEKSEVKLEKEQAFDRLSEQIERMDQRMVEKYDMNYPMALREREGLLSEVNPEDVNLQKKRALEAEIRSLGPVNLEAVQEYQETKERYDEMKARYDDLIQAESEINEVIEGLTRSIVSQFSDKFHVIDETFSKIFTSLFEGGSAHLRYTEPENLLETGIELTAQPPGKNLRHISLLSGGEKAMTAIALLLAFIQINPAPFVIIDEIDAALDDANITRFTGYLKRIKDGRQFIIITHRKTTLEVCERIYGVSMGRDGVSKILSVDRDDYLGQKALELK